MNRRTFQQRLLYHHLPLAVASAACCLLVFALVKSKYLPFRLSMATAYTGALLLSVTLVLGVLKVLRGETSPVSTDWRRDVGIWAALFGLGHLVIGLQVHSPGRMWTYFVYPTEQTRSFPLNCALPLRLRHPTLLLLTPPVRRHAPRLVHRQRGSYEQCHQRGTSAGHELNA